MKLRKGKQRVLGLALALALLASLAMASASGLAVGDQELLVNGSFEGGFVFVPGCGAVGTGWGCYTNGGSLAYGFYDDQWNRVVADGLHSQLIELNTMQVAASEADRFAGIFQTVGLVKGGTYELKLRGWIREGLKPDQRVELSEDAFRYRVQWGLTADGSTDWTKVTNWVELPWNRFDPRTSPGASLSFATKFTSPSDKVTLFVRVWKKWGTSYRELDVNLDSISLFGPKIGGPIVVGKPPVVVVPPVEPVTPVVVIPGPTPVEPPAAVCGGKNFIYNGSFEDGFNGGVGKGWLSFNNGGNVTYGFYDEMWTKVIKDGSHGQLIEINSFCRGASDPDRYAGIYQVVGGLKPGATYEFSLYGLMREEEPHPAEDAFRYRVQWGYAAADASPGQDDIKNWVELPWQTIYVRTAPGDLSYYSVRFQAPSDKVVISVRAWKKWGTTRRELDVNLDAIKLVGCELPKPPEPPCNDECIWYTVKPGDTVFGLALKYNSTVALIMERNKLANANLIYVGQKLCIVDP